MISAEDRALAKKIVDAIKADGGYTPDGPLTITEDLYCAMMDEMNTRLRLETERVVKAIDTALNRDGFIAKIASRVRERERTNT